MKFKKSKRVTRGFVKEAILSKCNPRTPIPSSEAAVALVIVLEDIQERFCIIGVPFRLDKGEFVRIYSNEKENLDSNKPTEIASLEILTKPRGKVKFTSTTFCNINL